MKRQRHAHVDNSSRKRAKHAIRAPSQSATATPLAASHPVLRRLYPHVLTLRHHLLSRLPKSSKGRRRRISQLGLPDSCPGTTAESNIDLELGQLLDSTLVGRFDNATVEHAEKNARERQRDLHTFTQQRSQTITGGTFHPGYLLQSEIVDFVIWLSFRRATSHKPSHLLCHGYQRAHKTNRTRELDADPTSSIPGLVAHSANSNVRTLRGPVWSRLQALLGQNGDRIMMDLLLECGVFSPIPGNAGNYYQLSGLPVSDLNPDQKREQELETRVRAPGDASVKKSRHESKSPSTITFVRSRMLYAKPALNAKGAVRFGMRHIHVLNRFTDRNDRQQTIHIMRYMFPRQYDLHNVFTSKVDPRETAMPFKDYTLREKDIHHSMTTALANKSNDPNAIVQWKLRVPKRLRGAAVALVDKLRALHYRCSYAELLRHYCPARHLHVTTSGEEACFMDMATPTADVSAFCRAVVTRVIPRELWGDECNQRVIMYWIDQFICLRRFESVTLHQVTQKIKVESSAWLCPPAMNEDTKMARSDFDKRKEIFLELVYWLFDSFLMPLIRSNFYVTESNVNRHRLFYFRHDIWRSLTEPMLRSMRINMLEHMPTEKMTRLLSMRPLGFSKVRLLPKQHGFRTIMNLRRRQQILRNGALSLGRSINSVMTPVFNVITYEKSLRPDQFGSSLFSVTDILPRLAAFKTSLLEQGLGQSPLYFAKVDVQSCFDTIPQARLLSMVESLFSMSEYSAGKHVEIKPQGVLQRLDGQYVDPLPVKRYISHSGDAAKLVPFEKIVQEKFLSAKTNTVFVNTNLQHVEAKADLLRLLREHVGRNLVKIGKRYYRQKRGIPQGSILSTILCNFFYAELESKVLAFALGSDSLLLRLLDDFLLITVNKQHAQRFIRVMHRGHADYGVVVKPTKSLTNFDVITEDGKSIPCSSDTTSFPYCGIIIDTRSLEIKKKLEHPRTADIEDSLTVDLSKVPGQTFHRKTLNAFKIQLKAMFIDTTLNSVYTVLANLYRSFSEAAVRCREYERALSKERTTCSSLLIKTMDSIIALAHVMLQRRQRTNAIVQSAISRRHLQWLACKAFLTAFRRRQTRHRVLLAWLDKSLAQARVSNLAEKSMLQAVVVGR